MGREIGNTLVPGVATIKLHLELVFCQARLKDEDSGGLYSADDSFWVVGDLISYEYFLSGLVRGGSERVSRFL